MQSLKSYWGTLSIPRVIAFAGAALGALLLLGALIFLFLPDAYLDGFLKGRITKALSEAYPAYSIQIAGLHYRVMDNRLECDSIALSRRDSTFSCTVRQFFVTGVGRIQLLWGGGVSPDNLVSSHAAAEDIVLTFPGSQYELRCARLGVSVPDSEIVIDTLELHPMGDDEQFFARSKFTQTRFTFAIPHCSVKGSACLGLIAGEMQCARIAEIRDPFLDVLINRDKPSAVDPVPPVMPNELLSSIVKTIQLDSVNIINARLKYCERFTVGSKPALLTFDRMRVLVEAGSRHGFHSDTVAVHAEGTLMDAGIMKVLMLIPVSSPEFTFQYSGSLGGMELSKLNPFLEVAEHKRFKTGQLHSAAFDVNVVAGHAKGKIRASYKDLKIVSVDGRTGSESGVGNTIVNLVANNVKLRTSNEPDDLGSMKIGEVKYTRARSDAFFGYAWFALRSGLSDVVGF